MKKYSKAHFLQKRLHSFSSTEGPAPSKETCGALKWFFAIFSENTAFFEKKKTAK